MSKWIDGEGYRKKVLFDEADLDSEDTRIQVVEIKSGDRVKPHFHKSQTEVYCVLNGEATLGIGQTDYQAEEGDILICKPGQSHHVINDSSETFRLLVVKTNYEEDDSYWKET